MDCREKNIAILGFGNIGSGVAQIAAGRDDVNLKYILDIRDFSGHELEKLFVKDVEEILRDESVSVVVETIGGATTAYSLVRRCLEAGKSVVSSNKALVAEHGTELLKIAHEKGTAFLFEASVGGAMPTIRPLLTTLCASRIDAIYAILNGTTNFILTRMVRDGVGLDEALKTAQALGYAETIDPSDDVDGIDAKRKLSILSSIALRSYVAPDTIPCTGIRGVQKSDLAAANGAGGTIKLVARYERNDNGSVSLGVAPSFVSQGHRLFGVDDVFNAVVLNCSYAGEVAFFGRGAGKLPTAGAVMSDVLEALSGKRYQSLLWTNEREPIIDNSGARRWFIVGSDGHGSFEKLTEAEVKLRGERCFMALGAGRE